MARRREIDDLAVELAERQHGAFALRQFPDGWCSPQLASERMERNEWLHIVRAVYGLPGYLDEWETVLDQPGGCLRITDPSRTIIDCGAIATPDELERMVESAVRRGLTNVPRLRARANRLRRPGRRGPAEVLAVLDRRPRGGHAHSEETILLQRLREAGLAEPVRQYRVGTTFFDLAWPDRKVLVELDGGSHRGKVQQRRDARKQNAAVLEGWAVLRFTWDDVEHELDRVLEEIRAALGQV
jgi:very-short-patch-repair endonuclease